MRHLADVEAIHACEGTETIHILLVGGDITPGVAGLRGRRRRPENVSPPAADPARGGVRHCGRRPGRFLRTVEGTRSPLQNSGVWEVRLVLDGPSAER